MTNWELRIEEAKSIVKFTADINRIIANARISWGCKEGTIRRREAILKGVESVAHALSTYDPIYLGM